MASEFGEYLTGLAELGQLYAIFGLIRTLANESQGLAGRQLEQCDVDQLERIAGIANALIARSMKEFDKAAEAGGE